LLDDGPLAREFALGPDALVGHGRLFREAVRVEAAGPVALARRLAAILPHLHADFLLLAHAAIIVASKTRTARNPPETTRAPGLPFGAARAAAGRGPRGEIISPRTPAPPIWVMGDGLSREGVTRRFGRET